MTTEQPIAPAVDATPPPLWPMYRAVVGLGIVCGLLIVVVYQLTKPIIAANKAAALRAAVFEVLPEARSSATFVWTEAGRLVPEGEATGAEVHVGYDAAGQFVGIAIEAAGMGYQDVISVLYGYSPARAAIIGIHVLESRETPGLGDKIGKDAAFLANFDHLDVSLDPTGSALAHPIEAVKHGTKTSPWQIDAITGATISSFAVGDLLRASTAEWVPRLSNRAAELARPEPAGATP